jgi:hypothetical protein
MGSATRRGWLSFEVKDEAQEHPTHVQPVHRCISQMLVVREGSGGLTTGERGVGSGGVKCEQHETVGTVETSWLGRRIRTLLVVYPERVRRLGEGHGVRRLKISARDRQFAIYARVRRDSRVGVPHNLVRRSGDPSDGTNGVRVAVGGTVSLERQRLGCRAEGRTTVSGITHAEVYVHSLEPSVVPSEGDGVARHDLVIRYCCRDRGICERESSSPAWSSCISTVPSPRLAVLSPSALFARIDVCPSSK